MREQLMQSADQIMERVAELLPKEYRGVYGESNSIKGNTGVVSGSKVGI